MALRRYRVIVHEGVREWLVAECHPQIEVRERVQQHFIRIFDQLEIAGELLGRASAKKLQGATNLWEARVNDPTGAYRIFFGYGARRAGQRTVIAAAYSFRKTENALPLRVRDTASKRVRAHLEEVDV